MSALVQRRLALSVFAVDSVMLLASFPVNALLLDRRINGETAFSFLFAALPLAGLLIALRQPSNRMAWILLGIGAFIAVGSLAEPYATYGVEMHPGALPAADVVAAISGALWVPAIGITGTYLLLLFPDGRLPTPRWRSVAWASAIVMVVLVATFVFSPDVLEQSAGVENPLGINGLEPILPVVLTYLLPFLPLCMLACALGLVMRFRRSSGIERLQLKWLATAAALVMSVYLVLMLVSWYYNLGDDCTSNTSCSPTWLDNLDSFAIATFVLIPVAIVVAVLKHDLYGIDRLISRTVSYAVITGTLLAVYLGLVTVVTRFTPSSSSLSVAASTLAVAALFQPLRRRVQAVVDRRFNRARYDAERTAEGFTRRLRNEVDLDIVRSDLLHVVHETLQPVSVSLWLRDGSR